MTALSSEMMTRHDLARSADAAAAAFRAGGWVWTNGVDLDHPYVPSAADLALSLSSMMSDVAADGGEYNAIRSGRLRVERIVDEEDETVSTFLLIELGEDVRPWRPSEAARSDEPQVGGA